MASGNRDERAAPVVASASTVVASTAPSVVASVVALESKPRATTDNATTNAPVVAASNATTERRALTWRIEINRRPKADGGYSFHWLYRFGSGDERRAIYGGTVDALIAMNPARWQKYLQVTNGKKRRSAR